MTNKEIANKLKSIENIDSFMDEKFNTFYKMKYNTNWSLQQKINAFIDYLMRNPMHKQTFIEYCNKI